MERVLKKKGPEEKRFSLFGKILCFMESGEGVLNGVFQRYKE